MNLPRYARVLLAIGSGVALGLSFPNYNLYLLAWIALGMLVLASAGAPVKEAPLYGFLHGQVFYPVCLPWSCASTAILTPGSPRRSWA